MPLHKIDDPREAYLSEWDLCEIQATAEVRGIDLESPDIKDMSLAAINNLLCGKPN